MRNPYETLGVAEDASLAIIRARYRELVRRNHPDITSQPDVERYMAAINEAWNRVKTAQAREATDAELLRRRASGSTTRKRQRTGDERRPFSGTKGWGEPTSQRNDQRPEAEKVSVLGAVAYVGVEAHHLEIWRTDEAGVLWHSWWPNDTGDECWESWWEFEGAPRPTVSVAAASWGPNHAEVFALGEDGRLWRRWWRRNDRTGTWSDWAVFDGRVRPPVAAGSYGPHHVEVVARSLEGDDLLHQWHWEGSAWSGWQRLGT